MLSYYVCGAFMYDIYVSSMYGENKAVPLEAWESSEGS